MYNKNEYPLKSELTIKPDNYNPLGSSRLLPEWVKGIMQKTFKSMYAFSLVEMLMALLVASLLMAALAPVMTRRMNDNTTISVEGTVPGLRTKTHEIEYGTEECSNIKTSDDGKSQYCEGEFVVPSGFNGNMTVTLVGAGGGGGTAPTAGYVEYTTAGSTNNFTVPDMVNELEATLVSGGAGGGAGGQVTKTQEYTTVGSNTFNIPAALKGKSGVVNMCGGGGSGGAASAKISWDASYSVRYPGAAGGGSGGYYENKVVTFANMASTEVFVGGGGGGKYPSAPSLYLTTVGSAPLGVSLTAVWCDYSYFMDKNDTPEERYNGITAEDGSGGAGGNTSNPYNSGRKGGKGGTLNGGSGGAHYGATHALIGGGGGGGGASRLGKTGDSHYLYVGGGGGGGGEGISVRKSEDGKVTKIKDSSGGGGGGGGGTGIGGAGGNSYYWDAGCSAQGGSGGKPGGNNGEKSGCNNGNPATSGAGGESPLSKYSDKCAGGHGEGYNKTFESRQYDNKGINYFNIKNPRPTGLDGIVAITYLDYGPGGSGGGAAHIVPLQKISTIPNETLNIKIGTGGSGGSAGKINSDATITNPTIGQGSNTNITPMITNILRNSTVLLTTPNGATRGLYGGSPTGQILGAAIAPYYGAVGWITNGLPGSFANVNINGFSNTTGKTAGNTTTIAANTYTNATTGGAGGTTTTPFTGTCTPGKGGTASNPKGGDATGYGCGGGGGYGLADGGAGSGGYARISWNKTWNITKKEYTTTGNYTGGGGAGGNILTYSIPVKSGEKVKIRIGKGGEGAKVLNNAVSEAKNGGDTVFKTLKAGGGKGGASPVVSTTSAESGLGGAYSTLCFGAADYLNNALYCAKGGSGANGSNATGGAGGNATKRDSKGNIITYGSGGAGGILDSGDNSNGKNASGFGAGGGGASVKDMNKLEPSFVTNNPNTGGSGANGKIIIQWQE